MPTTSLASEIKQLSVSS